MVLLIGWIEGRKWFGKGWLESVFDINIHKIDNIHKIAKFV